MNELQIQNQGHQITQGFTLDQIELIKTVIAKGASDDELKLFLYTSQKTGLDPLSKQIHFTQRNQKQIDGTYKKTMTIVTGIDGYRLVASRTGALVGIDDVIYDTELEVHPNKATVTVWKLVSGNRVPFTASARWSEYYAEKGGMWNKMPYLMLGKCAEALALRKAFPNDLSGIYTQEEMQQANNDDAIPTKQTQIELTPVNTIVAESDKPEDCIMPFGKYYKNEPLKNIPLNAVKSATQWAINNNKYPEFVNTAKMYIETKEKELSEDVPQ